MQSLPSLKQREQKENDYHLKLHQHYKPVKHNLTATQSMKVEGPR